MKAAVTLSEYIIIIGVILAAMIFFYNTKAFVGKGVETTYEMDLRATGEEIVDLIERVSSEPTLTYYILELDNSDLEINNSVMTLTRGNKTYRTFVPPETKDVELHNVNKICISKQGNSIIIYEDECPPCDDNGICTSEECSNCCFDCYGPALICIQDSSCDPCIGENCRNTPACACSSGVCCPEAKDNENGCTEDTGISQGGLCYCNNQCSAGLNCNSGHPLFNKVNNYCCLDGGMWNGTDCICNTDGTCTPDECNLCCPDCNEGSSACDDGVCTACIGENCENSPGDCPCSHGVCSPDDPSSDEYGCTDNFNIPIYGQCYSDNQCQNGLSCNPVHPDFKGFEKACCPGGLRYNGTDCIPYFCEYPCLSGCLIPERFDWRNYKGKNWLNPVRNQGSCGSCWAFSTIGSIEGVYNIENDCSSCNKDLSEQELVSSCCSAGSCSGGWPRSAFVYVYKSGVCDENCFPYMDSNSGCDKCSDWPNRNWKINDYSSVSSDIKDIKRTLICQGPISVSSFKWGHAIVLVSYEDNSSVCKSKYGKDGCWIIRNSWGLISGWWRNPYTGVTVWHENGYAYIPYSGHSYSDLINYVYYPKGVVEP